MVNDNKPVPSLKIGNFSIFIIIIVVILLTFFDTTVYIPPGHVGVFINKISGKINEEPLHSGYKFKLPFFQQIIEYPFYMQTIILTKSATEGSPNNDEINVNSVEGQPVSCDVSLSYTLVPDKVPFLYTSFRQNIENISHGFIRQTVRQVMQEVVGKMNIADFLGKNKAEAVTKIEAALQTRLKQYGFNIKQFTLNEIRPPESVIQAIEQKNIMGQDALRAQNELLKVKYEAQQRIEKAKGGAKAILEIAQAQAKANIILSQSITDTLVQYKSIEKWDGYMPTVSTKGGGAVPLINLNLPEKQAKDDSGKSGK
jgi:regulator of protease activity HflC (stomatin/prohibitin superfamily)